MRTETLRANRPDKLCRIIGGLVGSRALLDPTVVLALVVITDLLCAGAYAQTIVGTESTDAHHHRQRRWLRNDEKVVGDTILAPTGSSAAANAASGGIIELHSTAGPSPGPISATTTSGNVLVANNGGLIEVNGANGVTLSTSTGNVVFANVGSGEIEINDVQAIRTGGVGAILGTAGGTIDATNVTLRSDSTLAAISGRGAVAQGGGVINLHSGTSLTTTSASAGTFMALGALGAGSRITADAQIPDHAQQHSRTRNL